MAKKKTVKKKAAAKKTTKTKTVKKSTKKTAKRSPVKKTAKVKRVRKKVVTTLKPKEIKHFQDILLAKRLELIGDVNSMESESLKKSRLDAAGDLSSMPIHMADLGTDNFEQEFALDLMDSERKMLHEINCALKRIQDGVYGICEGTEKNIPKARLKASPWSRYCIEYARMVEKGLVIEGDKLFKDEQGFEYQDMDLGEIEDLDELEDEEQAYI